MTSASVGHIILTDSRGQLREGREREGLEMERKKEIEGKRE